MLSGRKSKVRDLSGRRLRKSFSMSVFLFGRRAAAASRLERRSRQAPEKGLLMRIHSTENSEEPNRPRRSLGLRYKISARSKPLCWWA